MISASYKSHLCSVGDKKNPQQIGLHLFSLPLRRVISYIKTLYNLEQNNYSK